MTVKRLINSAIVNKGWKCKVNKVNDFDFAALVCYFSSKNSYLKLKWLWKSKRTSMAVSRVLQRLEQNHKFFLKVTWMENVCLALFPI